MRTDRKTDLVRQPPALRQQTADHRVIGRALCLFNFGKAEVLFIIRLLQHFVVIGKAMQQYRNAAVTEQAKCISIICTDIRG